MYENDLKPVLRKGFTAAELLVVLMITSIVFGAVATLANAVGNAQRSTESMSESQAKLRYATLRIGESIRHARCALSIPTPTDGIALWRADDNDDAVINGAELVYIESYDAGGGIEQLRMTEFPDQSLSVTIAAIADGSAKTALLSATDERITVLLDACSNATFTYVPPTLVNLTFGIAEGGITTTYQISARVIGSADNLIDAGGELVVGGDDD